MCYIHIHIQIDSTDLTFCIKNNQKLSSICLSLCVCDHIIDHTYMHNEIKVDQDKNKTRQL